MKNGIKTWLVTGKRILADGGTRVMTGTAIGSTKVAAQNFFMAMQEREHRQALEPARHDPWRLEELTFVEVVR